MDEKNRGLQWSHIEPYCLVRTLLRQLWMLCWQRLPALWRRGSCSRAS